MNPLVIAALVGLLLANVDAHVDPVPPARSRARSRKRVLRVVRESRQVRGGRPVADSPVTGESGTPLASPESIAPGGATGNDPNASQTVTVSDNAAESSQTLTTNPE